MSKKIFFLLILMLSTIPEVYATLNIGLNNQNNPQIVIPDELNGLIGNGSTLNVNNSEYLGGIPAATYALTGNCPAGYVVMNTTHSGVQCVPQQGNSSFNQSLTDTKYIKTDGTSTTTAIIPFAKGINTSNITSDGKINIVPNGSSGTYLSFDIFNTSSIINIVGDAANLFFDTPNAPTLNTYYGISSMFGKISLDKVNNLFTIYTTGNLTLNSGDSIVLSRNTYSSQNISAIWFRGLYDWTVLSSSTRYLNFNGSSLNFNETSLNSTITSLGVANGFNSTFNSTYNGIVNNNSYLNNNTFNYNQTTAAINDINGRFWNTTQSYNRTQIDANNASWTTTYNATYNNILNQNCPVGQVVNGTLSNGTLICTTMINYGNVLNYTKTTQGKNVTLTFQI